MSIDAKALRSALRKCALAHPTVGAHLTAAEAAAVSLTFKQTSSHGRRPPVAGVETDPPGMMPAVDLGRVNGIA